MYFKKLLLILSCLVLLASCGVKFGEKAPQTKPFEISNNYTCMTEIGQRVSDYFDNKLSVSDVKDFAACVKLSLRAFEGFVRGKEKDSYTPEEVVKFLHEYFLKDNRISDKFLEEIKKFKQVLFGGSKEKITRSEFKLFIEHVDLIEEQVIRMLPYIPVLNTELGKKIKSQGGTIPSVEDTRKALMKTAEEFGGFLESSNRPLNLDTIQNYFSEFQTFLDWKTYQLSARSPQRWAHFVRSFKSIATKPPHNEIQPTEWIPLLKAASNWYTLIIDYHYNVKDKVKSRGPGLDAIGRIAHNAIAYIEDAVNLHPNKEIPFSLKGEADVGLFEFIDELDKMDFLTIGKGEGALKLEPFALKCSLHPIVNKVFGDLSLRSSEVKLSKSKEEPSNTGLKKCTLKDKKDYSLKPLHIRNIIYEFETWFEAQKFIEQGESRVCDGANLMSKGPSEICSLMKKIPPYFSEKDRVGNCLDRNRRAMIKKDEVFCHDRMTIVAPKYYKRFNLSNDLYHLTRLNVMRAIIRLLIRGFSEDPGRAADMSGVTRDEMQQFYIDARFLGAMLKFMDDRSLNTGERSFMEGNLFTSVGDGFEFDLIKSLEEDYKDNSLLTLTEGVELLMYVYSGGQVAKRAYKEFSDRCPHKPKDKKIFDNFGILKLDRACVEKEARESLPYQMSHLPGMKKFIENVPREDWAEFSNKLFQLGKNECSDPKLIESGEFSTMATILQYIEILFIKYDEDESGKLEYDEIEKAYTRFRGFLSPEIKMKKIDIKIDSKNFFNFKRILPGDQKIDPNDLSARREVGLELFSELEDQKDFELDVKKTFFYIVENGKAPADLGALLNQNSMHFLRKWKWLRKKFEIDRAGLADVFYTISMEARKGKSATCKP